MSLNYRSNLWITLDSPVKLVGAQRIAHSTVQLLNLLIGKPTVATTQYYGFDSEEGASHLANSWVRLKPPELDRVRPLCPLSHDGFDFPKVLDGWLQLAQSLQTPMDLLYSVLMKTGTFLETEVTELMQAVEAYCAATIPFCYMPEDEFHGVMERMLATIQGTKSDFRNRVKGTVRHLNRPSSRSYLKALFAGLDPKLVEYVTDVQRPSKFIDDAVKVRNTIVHPQSGSIWLDHTVDQILSLISRLKLLLVVVLLRDAGLPIEILQKRYSDHRQWRWG